MSLHILNNGFVTFKSVDEIKVKPYSNNSPLATKLPQIPFIFGVTKKAVFYYFFFISALNNKKVNRQSTF